MTKVEQMKQVFETIRKLKRGKHGLKVCPKCGSVKIRNSSLLSGWIIPDQYVCEDCGYTGYLILELERKATSEATS